MSDRILGEVNMASLALYLDAIRDARPGLVIATVGVGFGATLRMAARRILDTKARVFLWGIDTWAVHGGLEPDALVAIGRHSKQGHPLASPYFTAVAAAWRAEAPEEFRSIRWLVEGEKVPSKGIKRVDRVVVDGDEMPMRLDSAVEQDNFLA